MNHDERQNLDGSGIIRGGRKSAVGRERINSNKNETHNEPFFEGNNQLIDAKNSHVLQKGELKIENNYPCRLETLF